MHISQIRYEGALLYVHAEHAHLASTGAATAAGRPSGTGRILFASLAVAVGELGGVLRFLVLQLVLELLELLRLEDEELLELVLLDELVLAST